ncbi:unnamed protein product [Closterium sp. NIES-53]
MVIEGWLEPERVVVASAVSEPQPLAAAAPHAHALAGPAPIARVALVESPAPLVVVDAPPGAPILTAPLASVAHAAPIAAVGSSPHAVSATTCGPGPGEVGGAVALSAPVLPTVATSVPPPDVQAVPDPAPLAAAPLAQRQPSPGSISLTPLRHVMSERRRGGDTILLGTVGPRQTRLHPVAVVVDGGGGAVLERNEQASQSNSPRVAPAHASLPPAAPYVPAPPLPQSAVPPPPAPSASAAAHGNRMCLPWVPPVSGMEFVTVAGGLVTAQYPSLLPVAPAPPADLPAVWLVALSLSL